MNLQDEYFDLTVLVGKLNREIDELTKLVSVKHDETNLIVESGMSKMDKDYIIVHNHDAIKVLRNKKHDITTKRDIIKHRVDFLEELLCKECGGRGKRYLDFKCEKCNGTGLNNV